ncbi:YigZ family protein [Corticicoccus populi]|uniref:YigZ family protein n=1 Tax=Corticicoccus populi TaxID=1812821 RepID=A0ABW5WUT7_9STAP
MEQKYMNHNNDTVEIEINRSRFISHIERTETEKEAKAFISRIKKEHSSANHNCSAYIVGKSALIQKADDDGEPTGTAGVPILEVLKREELYNVTVVVTRYFGGIKLGAGGLIRAYSSSASAAVKEAGKVFEIDMHPVTVTLDYTFTSKFEHYLNTADITAQNIDYTDKVTYHLLVKTEDIDALKSVLQETTKNTFNFIQDDPVQAESVLKS